MNGSSISDAMRRPAVRIVFAVHVALATILSFVPLFDALGFERAFAAGLLSTITSPIVATSLLRRARERGGDDPGRVFFHALLMNLVMLVPTVVAGVLVEALAQPCDTEEGLTFVILVAGGNAIVGTALGIVGGALTFRRGLPGLAISTCLAIFLGAALARLYAEPQIFVYSAPFGFWPGSIYDEELSVDRRLIGFRAYSTLLALTIVTIGRAFIDRTTLFTTLRAPRWTTVLGGLALALLTARAHSAGPNLGFDLDRAAIVEALAHVEETEHFHIHIDPTVTSTQARYIREDHELRYAQLERFFDGAPEGKITSFVYRDQGQKAALMGAGRTQVARPWAKEIHIDGFVFPHRVLKHELAHVFASRIASGMFRVPATSGIFVNIGIVEGIAVAADWRVDELTVHGWTRAMQELELLPDLRRSLDVAGFWSTSSSRAYTATGSFVRYLVETHGMDRFAVLYRENDFELAYERSLDALVTEWEAFVGGLPLSRDDLLIAEHRFRRPSIFQKVCAHRAANLAASGYGKLESGNLVGGIADLEELMVYTSGSTRPLIAISVALMRRDRFDEAEAYARRALDLEGTTQKASAFATETMGAIAWHRGDKAGARAAFDEVRRLHLSTPSDRLQISRLAALERPSDVQDVLRDYLTGALSPTATLVRLGDLARRHPEDGLIAYLYARALENADLYVEGLAALDSPLTLPGEAMTLERGLTRGRLLYHSGRPAEAEGAFVSVRSATADPGIRETARDWIERARFAATGDLPTPE